MNPSTVNSFGKARKIPLWLYASFSPATLTWYFETTDRSGHLLASNFGRAPRDIIHDELDGIAYGLAMAHSVIAERFPNHRIIRCVTELRGLEVERWAA